MIVDLPSTTTADVAEASWSGCAPTPGRWRSSRVLTLLVVVDEARRRRRHRRRQRRPAAQHPCRIIVVVAGNKRGAARLDAQIRLGGDAGASEVVVLRLYGQLADHGRAVVTPLLLADSPIVAWWPADGPTSPSQDPIGRDGPAPGHRRRAVQPGAAHGAAPPRRGLRRRRHRPRLVADHAVARPARRRARPAALRAGHRAPPSSRPPTPPRATCSPAGWPCGCAARSRIARARNRSGIISVRLERASGTVDLVRPLDGNTATLSQPGPAGAHPGARPTAATPSAWPTSCAASTPTRSTRTPWSPGCASAPCRARRRPRPCAPGKAPSVAEAERTAARLRKAARAGASSAMVEATADARRRPTTRRP